MYTANFYNGLVSQATTVQIEINKQFLKIHFEDGTCETLELDSIQTVEKSGEGMYYIKSGANLFEVFTSDDLRYLTVNKLHTMDKWFYNLYYNFSKVIAINVSFILLLIGGLFVGLPYLTDWIAEKIPVEFETKLADQFEKMYITDKDIDRSHYVNELLSHYDFDKKYTFTIYVVNSPIVNAYALPGGKIVIYSGLLDMFETKEELLALLSHEASHVNQRHSMKTLARQLTVFSVLSSVFGDVSSLIVILTNNIAELSNLSYSRDLEEEADKEGFKLLLKNNVHPKSMITLFNLLKKNQLDSLQNEFLSTHPLSDNRIKYIENKIAQSKMPSNSKPNTQLDNLWDLIKKKK